MSLCPRVALSWPRLSSLQSPELRFHSPLPVPLSHPHPLTSPPPPPVQVLSSSPLLLDLALARKHMCWCHTATHSPLNAFFTTTVPTKLISYLVHTSTKKDVYIHDIHGI